MISIGPAGTFQGPNAANQEPVEFTLYWRNGDRQVLPGETVEKAFTMAGYGAGAMKALDFYMQGNCQKYKWCKNLHQWHLQNPDELFNANRD